jgi:phosphohistidine phosphatase
VQTWEGIRDGLGAEAVMRIEDSLYTADADGLLTRLNTVPESVESALLIGHNPALEELALRLVGDGEAAALRQMRAKYPTGGLATLSFSGEWGRLAWGMAHLDGFVVPRQLK